MHFKIFRKSKERTEPGCCKLWLCNKISRGFQLHVEKQKLRADVEHCAWIVCTVLEIVETIYGHTISAACWDPTTVCEPACSSLQKGGPVGGIQRHWRHFEWLSGAGHEQAAERHRLPDCLPASRLLGDAGCQTVCLLATQAALWAVFLFYFLDKVRIFQFSRKSRPSDGFVLMKTAKKL